MIRKSLLPLIAFGLLCVAIYHVARSAQEPSPSAPPVEPSATPFQNTVAGSGIVEPLSENISIGSPLPGVVTNVAVTVGQKVKKGDPLFTLDDRQLKAELEVRKAAWTTADAQLKRLDAQPRPEEVPASEARVRESQAMLTEQEDQLQRAKDLFPKRAINEEEYIRRQQAHRIAREQLTRAEADFRLLKAGAWEADKVVARANVAQAKAQMEQVRTELERLTVRAQEEGEVLQIDVRPGEFVGAPPEKTLVLLGKVSQLHVRVDIDEHDIPRFKKGVPAKAVLRGQIKQEFPLTFVRVEPYVRPKRSLTGDNTERVDTRVLQVIYALTPGEKPVFVGQQVDVFINVEGM